MNNSEFSLTWRLARNALPLLGLNYKAGLADMPDCPRCGSGLEETAEHAYCCERVRPFWDHVGEWTARIEPKQLVLLDVGYRSVCETTSSAFVYFCARVFIVHEYSSSGQAIFYKNMAREKLVKH